MKKLKIGKSDIHGKGLFTGEPIRKGDLIAKVHSGIQLDPETIKYMPTQYGRFYNHDEKKFNTTNEIIGNHRYLRAIKNIPANTELTANYREHSDMEQPENFGQGKYASFDFDKTIATDEGLAKARQMLKDGYNLFIVSARDKVTPDMVARARKAGIPEENIIATGSDEAKVRKVKQLGVEKHFDDKPEVIAELGLVGEQFKKGGGLNSKKYTRSITGTNKLFTKNNLFKKKSTKRIYDPNAKYYAEGGESGCPQGFQEDPVTGDCVVITERTQDIQEVSTNQYSPYISKYEESNPRDAYVYQKKADYLRKNKGLNKMAGLSQDNFNTDVEGNYNRNWEYDRNSEVIKQFAKDHGINPKNHVELVEKMADKGNLSYDMIANSKYGSKLQPSLWARSLAGAQELGNFVVKQLPGEQGDVFNKQTAGLTKKEWDEIHNSGTGALETLAVTDLPGAVIANSVADLSTASGGNYQESPGLLSGELKSNVDPTKAALLNPFLYAGIGEGLASAPKLAEGVANLYSKGLTGGKKIVTSIDNAVYPTRTYRASLPGGNEALYEASDLSKKVFNKGDFTTKNLDEARQYLAGSEATNRKGLLTGQDMNLTEYKVPFWKKDVSFDPDVVDLKNSQGVDINTGEYIIPNNKFLYPRKTTQIKAVPEELKVFNPEQLSSGDLPYYPSSIPVGPASDQFASKPWKYIEDQINAVTGHDMPLTWNYDPSLGPNQNIPLYNWEQPQFPINKGWTKGNTKTEVLPESSEINWGKWNSEIPENKPLMQEYTAIEETSKANGTWMKNPDGTPFNGTPEQFVQQQSQNFKNAFGDNYVTGYHGSNRGNIQEFREGKAGKLNDGVYLADSPKDADTYRLKANPFSKRYELAARTENPLTFDAKSNFWASLDHNELVKRIGQENFNALGIKPKKKYDTAEVTDIAKKLGYDAVNFENIKDAGAQSLLNGDILRAFRTPVNKNNYSIINPKNIKSLIGNNGMFDMTNPNIYKALIPAIGVGAASQMPQNKYGGLHKFVGGGPTDCGEGMVWSDELQDCVKSTVQAVDQVRTNQYSPYAVKYDQMHPQEREILQKKAEYLRKYKNLNRQAGVNQDNFPEKVLRNIINQVNYERNNYIIDQYSKAKGFNPNKHVQLVENIAEKGNKSYDMAQNSKYGSKLKPSLWSRTLAGAQELGNFVVKQLPGTQGDVFKYEVPGLSKKERKEIADSKTGALETFAVGNLPGQAIANTVLEYGKTLTGGTGADYKTKDIPNVVSGEYMPGVDDNIATVFNPLTYTGLTTGLMGAPNMIRSALPMAKNIFTKGKTIVNSVPETIMGSNYVSGFNKIKPGINKFGQNKILLDKDLVETAGQLPEQLVQRTIKDFTKPIKTKKNFNNTGIIIGEDNANIIKTTDALRKEFKGDLYRLNKLKAENPGINLEHPSLTGYHFTKDQIKKIPDFLKGIEQNKKSTASFANYFEKQYADKMALINKGDEVFQNIAKESPQYIDEIAAHLKNPTKSNEDFLNDLVIKSNTYARFQKNSKISDGIRGSSIGRKGYTMDVEGIAPSDYYGAQGFKIQPTADRVWDILNTPLAEKWSKRIPEFKSDIVLHSDGMHHGFNPKYRNFLDKRLDRLDANMGQTESVRNTGWSDFQSWGGADNNINYQTESLIPDYITNSKYFREPRHLVFESPTYNAPLENFQSIPMGELEGLGKLKGIGDLDYSRFFEGTGKGFKYGGLHKFIDGGQPCPDGYTWDETKQDCVSLIDTDWLSNWYANRKLPLDEISNKKYVNLMRERLPQYNPESTLLEELSNLPPVEYQDVIDDDPNNQGQLTYDKKYNPDKILLKKSLLDDPVRLNQIYNSEASTAVDVNKPGLFAAQNMVIDPGLVLFEDRWGDLKGTDRDVAEDHYNYTTDPEQDNIHSLIFEERYKRNLKPDQVLTETDINKWKSEAEASGALDRNSPNFDDTLYTLFKLAKDNKSLMNWFNQLASNDKPKTGDEPQYTKQGGSIGYKIGDEIDEATMRKLKKLGYKFQKA